MQLSSNRTILGVAAVVALSAAVVAQTAAFARGPGSRSDQCSASCVGAAIEPQAQVRARDGSGVGAQTGGAGYQRAHGAARVGNGPMGAGQVGAGPGNAGSANGIGTAAGAGFGPAWAEGAPQGTPPGMGSCDVCPAEMGTLSEADTEGLIFMANEEKLAHDVYLAFAEAYGSPVFDRVAASEGRHQLAVDTILERYGIEDETSGMAVGEFSDPAFTTLYADLVEQGSTSLDDALAVAIGIEGSDIADLDERMTGLDETAPDVYVMYEHLSNASGNHLAAFQRLS